MGKYNTTAPAFHVNDDVKVQHDCFGFVRW
jgi:hypothetical protein